MEVRKLIRLGKSTVVSIPSQLAKVLQVMPGDYVTMHLADKDTLVIKRNENSRKRTTNHGR